MKGWMISLLATACAHAVPQASVRPVTLVPGGQREASADLPSEASAGTTGERGRRLLDEALLASSAPAHRPGDLVSRFKAAVDAAPGSISALLDYAIVLDRAGRLDEAEQAYRSAAQIAGAPDAQLTAARRAAALALDRGDAEAARGVAALAAAALPDDPGPRILEAEVALASGDLAGALAWARVALARTAQDVHALCVLARIHLAQGSAGTARILASRAAQLDPEDAEPLLVQVEIARAQSEPAAELAAARAAVAADPASAEAAVALGRALFERGQAAQATEELTRAAELGPELAPVHLALGSVLAAQERQAQAEEHLSRAAQLAPRAPEPHYELARLKLEGQGDAKTALEQAKLFLRLSTKPPPPGHPVHALVQRCEEALKGRAQASVVQ